MSERYLIGLDLGTTNIKGILITADGKIKAEFSIPVDYMRDNDGSVEYEAKEFFEMVSAILKELSEKAEGRIEGVSMVSASGNTVLLDVNMTPVRPVISWLDKRFKNEAGEMFSDPYDLYKVTGWPFNNTFPLAHLSWIKKNQPETYKKAHKICMVTDYVNYLLTGNLSTNPSTATTFYLQDQKKSVWSEEIIAKLDINTKNLPEIIPSGHIIGNITEAVEKLTGIERGTPVIAGAFDHPGAARGLGILDEGDLLLSCGTSWVGFYPAKNREKLIALNMLVDPFLSGKGCWAGMFSLPRIGNNIDSLIEKWISKEKDGYKAFNELAALSKPGSGGLKINPMDDMDKNLGAYKKEDICRAIMEGTAKLMKEKIQFYAKNGLLAKRIVMAGGPTRSGLWMDILCDILGVKISIGGSHAGALGAAVMAGIGAGLYENEYDARQKGVCNDIV